jgi:DNA-binding response OmpR family regulator
MEEPVRALVVDDEEALRFFIEETLRRDGHVVTGASSGEEALERLRDTPFDLIVLDLMLGGRVDGLRVLEAVRWRWPETVVVILTAHGSLESAMAAIREGVDGYLLKPIEPAELRRAVREAMERRMGVAHATGTGRMQQEAKKERPLQRGPFAVELKRHAASMDGQSLELTSREFTLLAHLMQNADRAISPQELVRVVRQYETEDPYEAREIIKWYVHRLRRKVEPDPSDPRYILTVRGVGYRFEA